MSPAFGGAFFVAGVAQSVAQNDLKQTDLIRFGLKGIQQPQQKRCRY